MRSFYPCPEGSDFNRVSSALRDKVFNWYLLDRLVQKKCLDFIGINYYCKEYVQWNGLIGQECGHLNHGERKNQPGWSVYPQGLYEILINLKKYGLPLMITENGTAEIKDEFYREYLLSHLNSLACAIKDGAKVEGYFWWSLLDNFEWDKGFSQRFGLVEVDFKTFRRQVKPFADTYADICRKNSI
jgi:beta-glucosidase